jgi:hypothetical protein
MIKTALIVIVVGIIIASLVLSIISLLKNKTVVKREIVTGDKGVEITQEGILQASSVSANSVSDGMSVMQDGSLTVQKDISCKSFIDRGNLRIEKGNLSTKGTLECGKLTVGKGGIQKYAELFGKIYIMKLQPIYLGNNRWTKIDSNTRENQFFLPADDSLHDGIEVDNNNIRFEQSGRWKYNMSLAVNNSDSATVDKRQNVDIALSVDEPNLKGGFGYISSDILRCDGVVAADKDQNFSIWMRSEHMLDVNVSHGHILVQFIGI